MNDRKMSTQETASVATRLGPSAAEGNATLARLREAIVALLDAAEASVDVRVEVLGGAFVAEAVRPQWIAGRTPEEAHHALRIEDPELADAVEALSPMLLGRAQAHIDAEAAIHAIGLMLNSPD